MKKLFKVFLLLFILVGCTNETPTKKVEEFFNNYQNLDEEVLSKLEYSMERNNLNEQEKNVYRDLMRKQYKDLEYNIKKIEINNDKSTVIVELEVYDYSIAQKKTNIFFEENNEYFLNEENEIDEEKYTDYKLDIMKNIKDRIKYTIDINLIKRNKRWYIEDLNDSDIEKIHGMFNY